MSRAWALVLLLACPPARAAVVDTADVIDSFRRWKHIIEFVREGEMPPEDAMQPSITESNQVVAAIEAILISEARKHAGDPGVVLAGREDLHRGAPIGLVPSRTARARDR